MVNIKVRKVHPAAILPAKAHPDDAGWDVATCGAAGQPFNLVPGAAWLVSTGLAFDIPPGWQISIRPRSGLALKHAITVLNAPSTIDAGYHGEVKVILINLGGSQHLIKPGDRIAQLVVEPVHQASFTETTKEFAPSARGTGGFGSSG